MADLPRESGRVELVSDRIKLGSRRICRGSGRLGDAPLPKLRGGCGAEKVKRADVTSASAETTKKNAP